jgi:hypothetical protein
VWRTRACDDKSPTKIAEWLRNEAFAAGCASTAALPSFLND